MSGSRAASARHVTSVSAPGDSSYRVSSSHTRSRAFVFISCATVTGTRSYDLRPQRREPGWGEEAKENDDDDDIDDEDLESVRGFTFSPNAGGNNFLADNLAIAWQRDLRARNLSRFRISSRFTHVDNLVRTYRVGLLFSYSYLRYPKRSATVRQEVIDHATKFIEIRCVHLGTKDSTL